MRPRPSGACRSGLIWGFLGGCKHPLCLREAVTRRPAVSWGQFSLRWATTTHGVTRKLYVRSVGERHGFLSRLRLRETSHFINQHLIWLE